MNNPDMLNLSYLKVVNVNNTESPFDYYIVAESTAEIDCCQSCGIVKKHALVKYGKLIFTYMDIPTHDRRVVIRVERQRYMCRESGSTFFEKMLDMDKLHDATRRPVKHIREKSLIRTFTSLADDTGLSDKTIRNIFHEYVAELEAKYERVMPRVMGIDKVHLLGKPRCVITNIEQSTIIDMLEDNYLPTLRDYFIKVKEKRCIEYVAMDMYSGYRTICSEMIVKAKVVIDKYHVVQSLIMALKTVRADIGRTLSKNDRREFFRSRFLLFIRRGKLNDEQNQVLGELLDSFPALWEAYALKEFFMEVYDAKTREEAEKRFQDWLELINDKTPQVFKKFAKAASDLHDQIFNYFDGHVTNAYTESLNRTIRDVDRYGRGHSFEVLRAKILFTKNIQKPVLPSVQKRRFRNLDFTLFPVYDDDIALQKTYGTDISTLSQLLAKDRF